MWWDKVLLSCHLFFLCFQLNFSSLCLLLLFDFRCYLQGSNPQALPLKKLCFFVKNFVQVLSPFLFISSVNSLEHRECLLQRCKTSRLFFEQEVHSNLTDDNLLLSVEERPLTLFHLVSCCKLRQSKFLSWSQPPRRLGMNSLHSLQRWDRWFESHSKALMSVCFYSAFVSSRV
jgi:hypothetical protein